MGSTDAELVMSWQIQQGALGHSLVIGDIKDWAEMAWSWCHPHAQLLARDFHARAWLWSEAGAAPGPAARGVSSLYSSQARRNLSLKGGPCLYCHVATKGL